VTKRKIPTLNEALPRLVPGQFLAIMRDIEALKNGEFFIYGGTYNERKTVQADELARCFAYQEELFVSDTDLGEHLDKTLRAIQSLLDGKVWSPGTLDDIAHILRNADYPVRDPDNVIPDVVIQDNSGPSADRRTAARKRIDDEKEAAVYAALQSVAKGIK
jgi:hypothetical protein